MTGTVVVAGVCGWIALMNLWPGAGATRGLRPHRPARRMWDRDPAGVAAAGLAGLVVWLILGPHPITMVASPAAGLAVAWMLPRLAAPGQRRRLDCTRAQFPETVDLLRYGLDAGLPLRTVVARVAGLAPAPTCDLLARIVGQVETGQTDAQAWRSLGDDPVWGDLARDLARGVESGAAMSRLLAVAADQARIDNAAELQRRARAVGVRSVLPLVVCYLPAFLLVGVVPIIASTLAGLDW